LSVVRSKLVIYAPLKADMDRQWTVRLDGQMDKRKGYTAVEMPFGKHRGQEVEELPTSYLRWCLDNLGWMNDDLREEMEEVLSHREGASLAGANYPRVSAPAVNVTLEAITQVYRELTLRWHPDRGGSAEAMAALNAFMERIRDILG
jgi:uncharacterized protein (DUF3820 family)